jgi:hypothetical protein
LAWIQSKFGGQFEFFSNFDRWVDRTTKSRLNIACDQNYKPTVRNKKRNLFGFEMLKNLKICKVKCETIELVFSIHLLDRNKVGNSIFWDDLCGAICLAMNTALVHPDWVTGDTEMDGMSEYREGCKNIEKFFVTREGKRAFHSVDHVVGAKLLMLFQTALVMYSEQTVEQYAVGGIFENRQIHQKCFHGLPKYPASRLACIKKVLEASAYIVQNCTWSCVSAGIKSKVKSEEKLFKFGDAQEIHDFIQEKRRELQQRVENLFEDPEMSPQGNNLLLSQNVIFQHDVGIEVRPHSANVNFYPHGPKSAEIVKKAVDHISNDELAVLMVQNIDNALAAEPLVNQPPGIAAVGGDVAEPPGLQPNQEQDEEMGRGEEVEPNGLGGQPLAAVANDSDRGQETTVHNQYKRGCPTAPGPLARKSEKKNTKDPPGSRASKQKSQPESSIMSRETAPRNILNEQVGGQGYAWFAPSVVTRIRGGAPEEDQVVGQILGVAGEDEILGLDQGNIGVEDVANGEIEEVEGIADDVNEAVQPFVDGMEEDQEEEAMDGAEYWVVNEQALSPSKFLRYPFHLTTGLLANTHVMDLQLKVIITEHFDQENNLWIRTEVRLKNGTRVVQGMQIYSPRERALLSRRSRDDTHRELSGYSALTQRLLDPSTSPWQADTDVAELQQSLRKLTVRSREILEGYKDFHSGEVNGRAEVRFEYAFARNDWSKGQDNYPALPLDPNDTNLWPFDAIVMAEHNEVLNDIQQLHSYAISPMEALTSMDPQNIPSLSPAIKTAFVHMAEIVQQMVNSTDPGMQGTHRTIVKSGLVDDYARVSVPMEHRTILDTNTRTNTNLPFGINPRLLPLAPEFTLHYQTRAGQDNSPGFFLQLMKERGAKLQNPAVFTLIHKRLRMLVCRLCHGIVPGNGVPIPGVMEGTDFGKWMDLDEIDKGEAMKLLGEWLNEIYVDEFNFLIRKALEHKKNHAPSVELLRILIERKSRHNWQIITVQDLVGLTTEVPNLEGFLDCSLPESDRVTIKGRLLLENKNAQSLTCVYFFTHD